MKSLRIFLSSALAGLLVLLTAAHEAHANPAGPDIAVEQSGAVADGGGVDFGSEPVGSAGVPRTFTITNPGGLDLSDLVVSSGTGEFAVSTLSSTTVTPNGTGATFTVTFIPSATGSRTATLEIASNVAGSKNPYEIMLTGTGIDLTPPETTIDSGPSGTVNKASATFTFSASEDSTFTYTVDGGSDTVGSSPVTLTGLTAGSHTFSVYATDMAANADATPATRTWTVQFGVVTTPVFQGATAGANPSPGDAVPGEPVGTTFKSFGVPALNGAGKMAFLTNIKAGAVTKAAIFDGTSVVARKGGNAPASGTTYASFNDPALNSQSEVAFLAVLSGATVKASNDTALITNDGGSLVQAVRTNDVIDNTAGARLGSITAFELLDNAVLFSGLLQSTTRGVSPGPGGVTTDEDYIVCRWTKVGGVELLLREREVMGGKRIKTFSTLLPEGGSVGQARKGNQGTLGLARVEFTDGTEALMELTGGGNGTVIAESGGAAILGGATFESFGLPALNAGGDAAYLSTLTDGVGGVGAANNVGLFADTTAGGDGTLMARKGETVGGFTLAAFKTSVVNAGQAVASVVKLGGAVTTATNKAVLHVTGAGSTKALVARTGGEPAGVTGAKWKAFKSVVLPDGLGPVFTATMVTGLNGTAGPGGVKLATDQGLWAQDSTGVVQLIVREGVTLIGGKRVKSFTVLGTVDGSPGQTRAFNAANQIAYRATFSDGSQAVVLVDVP